MDHYNNSLSSILDIHAPLKTRTVNFTRSAPWYTNQHRAMKRSGRVLERAYTTSGLTVHKLAYWEHQKSYAKALSSASRVRAERMSLIRRQKVVCCQCWRHSSLPSLLSIPPSPPLLSSTSRSSRLLQHSSSTAPEQHPRPCP
uniref:Uncharacterized protein n=1 Tax=Knipowitschia caucasica TaxID=637954 RepID=A0AAV2J2H2_KNICA